MALAAGTEQVGPPNKEIARPVAGVIRVLASKRQPSLLELCRDMRRSLLARRLGGTPDLEWITVRLWRGRQPSHALGAHVEIDEAPLPALRISKRGENLGDREPFVLPLLRVCVPVRGRIHVAGRPRPIEGERERHPAGLRSQLFLADVM